MATRHFSQMPSPLFSQLQLTPRQHVSARARIDYDINIGVNADQVSTT